MGARSLAWLASLALILVPLAADAQTVESDSLPIVRSLRFEGNEHFSSSEIQRAIVTRASGCKSFLLFPFCLLQIQTFERTERLDPRELRTDVARIRVFYFRRGFRQVAVDTSIVRVPGYVDVTFEIREGQPVEVRELAVAGLGGILDSAEVISQLNLQSGEPFSEVAIRTSADSITRALRNRGYASAEVLRDAFIPSDDSLGAYVVLNVHPGSFTRVGEIRVDGAVDIDTTDIKRLVDLRSGSTYRERDLVQSQRRLYTSGLFEYVDIAPVRTAADSVIDVNVQVVEGKLKNVQFGLGLSTDECFQVEAAWLHRSFLGGMRRLNVSGGLSNILTAQLAQQFPCRQAGSVVDDESIAKAFNQVNWRLQSSFQQPWFLGTSSTLSLSLFAYRQSFPDIFAQTGVGGEIALTRALAIRTPLTLFYRAQRDRLLRGSADVYFCANFFICQPVDISRLEEPLWLSPLGASLTRARALPELNPRGGYRWRVQAEHASNITGSDWEYNQVSGEISWYLPTWARNILALRLRGGWTNPVGSGIADTDLEEPLTHPLKRFYGGGASTVRGYGQNLLGPKVLLVNPELLTDTIRTDPCDPADIVEGTWECDPEGLDSNDFNPNPVGGLLSLIGNVELRVPFGLRWSGAAFFDIGQIWRDRDDVERLFDDLGWSPGFGVRYLSPVGPLRLDVGYNTGGAEILPVVTQRPETNDIVVLTQPFLFNPFDTFFSRLQFHFAIGHAF